jgi:hypothetical protein
MAFNLWHTTTTKEPARYASGESVGQANPADIRGSYTFGDVAAAFPGVSLAELASAFGVRENESAFQVKSLEAASEGAAGEYEIGTDSVRLFVARYLDLPYEPEAGTGLPRGALEILAATGRLDARERADLQARVVGAAPAAAPATTEETGSAEDRTVKGMTTFKELADWGVSTEALGKLFGGEVGAPGVSLRDHCGEKGIELSTVREQIQELVDAAKQ